MFSLFHSLGAEAALRREFLPFVAAFIIAELFYKFHSFTLECGAFLLTWWLLSFAQNLVAGPKD